MIDELRELVSMLESSMKPAEVVAYLRARYPEKEIKLVLDGLPYHVDTDVSVDEHGNRACHAYDIKNYYDGELVGRLRTIWTYWDAERSIVRDMIVDDGVGSMRRTIVHHRPNGEPESVETLAIESQLEKTSEVSPGIEGLPEPIIEAILEPVVVEQPVMAVEVIQEPAIIEVPLTRWQRFKKRAEKIFFLLPDDV